jgi:hypothetical protein
VLAGRSLWQVEIREDNALRIAALAWLVMVAALAITSLTAAWVWPAQRGPSLP